MTKPNVCHKLGMLVLLSIVVLLTPGLTLPVAHASQQAPFPVEFGASSGTNDHVDTISTSLSRQLPVGLASQDHPRIFFSSQDIPELRNRFQTTHSDVWQPVISFAQSMLGSSPPMSCPCPGLEPRQLGDQMISFAFAYVLTGDQAYFDLTRRYLLAYSEWQDWGDEGECGDRGLAFSHMLFGNAIAYDWVYNDLSDADRATIGGNLARRAQELYEASTAPYKAWDNWWRRAYVQNHHWINNAALGIAALVLDGHDARSEAWLSQASEMFTRIRDLLEGKADGSWHEGLSYQTYGLSLSLPFLVNLRRLTGQDLMPHTYLRNYAYWRLYNYLPHIVHPVFTHGDWELSYGNAHQPQQLLRLVASEYSDARAQWLAQRLIDADGRHASVWSSPWYVFEGLWYNPSIPAQAPDGLPLDRTFPDFEGVIWRSGWGDNDLVFALKTGPYGGRNSFTTWVNGQYPWDHPGVDKYNVGHDHDDTNTFYLYRGNVDLSSENLGNDESQTSFHNALLIDGSGQYRPPAVYNSIGYYWREPRLFEGIDGLLQATYQAGGFSFLISDATNRYRSTGTDGEPTDFWLNEYKRHVLFVKPGYVVMVDNIRSDTTHRYDWVAHFGSSVTMEESWVKGTAASNQMLGIKVLSPASFSTSIGNDGKDYVRVRPSSDVADVRFVNVLYPTDTTNWDLKPVITSLGETDQATGVRVSLDGTQDHLFKYGSEGSVSLGEYEFNGQVASVIKDSQGNLTHLFLGKGTHLADSNGSRTLLQASNPATVLEATYSGTALALSGENVEGLSLYAPNVDPGEVTLNGQPVDAARDGDSIILGDFSPTPTLQPSATSVPPTNTPVPPTNTPLPTTTMTSTPTNTPVPPTNTPLPTMIATSTPTSAPLPPTPTPTSAPAAVVPLQPGWNLVSVPVRPNDTSAEAVLSTIAGEYDAVYAYDASDEVSPWKQLDPSVPSFANDLLTIDETKGLWLHGTSATTWTFPDYTLPAGITPLHPGWNLVGYPLQDAQPIAEALASIEGNYTLVYTQDPSDQADPWKTFDPAAPPWSNELTQMVPGRGYWILVTQPCEWSLGSQSDPALSRDSLLKRETAALRPQEIPAEGSGSIPRPPSIPGNLRGPIQIIAAGS